MFLLSSACRSIIFEYLLVFVYVTGMFVVLGLPQLQTAQVPCTLNINCQAMAISDPEAWDIIDAESCRQERSLELIASENYASLAVREALGSTLTNKYSEGKPGARYYAGNQYIDKMELLCKKRALDLYGLKSDEWSVNVQPYSGSLANFEVYAALLSPHDRIMGLDLFSGGHLSHGYYSDRKKISASSVFFESLSYEVDHETGLIDYDDLRKRAKLFQPKLIIAGGSAYPREINYGLMREIADSVGALLLTDIAHISGLVAAGESASPFEHSHIVTTTTHKSLRGPKGALIYSLRQFSDKIDFSVFPRMQSGPHNNQIAAVAIALKEATTDEFRRYAKQVKANARTLADALRKYGYTIVTGGTDNHIVLWDLRPDGIEANKIEAILECISVSVNRNVLLGDKSAFAPGGVRLGTLSMTTRGFVEADFIKTAAILHQSVNIAKKVESRSVKNKELAPFKAALVYDRDVEALQSKVVKWVSLFHYPGR